MSLSAGTSRPAQETTPEESSPSHSQHDPVDQPIDTLGEESSDEDADGDVGADAAETSGDAEPVTGPSASVGGGEGRREESAAAPAAAEDVPAADSSTKGWQAVWAADQNAYYFWNTVTGEVTWTNPLVPPPAAEAAPPPPLPPGPAPPRVAPAMPRPDAPTALPDIDPDLAYLLPPEQRGGPADVRALGRSGMQTANFNARTGKFSAADTAFSVTRLDEYNRMRRFNEHYFDMDGWEKERAAEHAKRKRDEEAGVGGNSQVTRKDMDRFRKKAAEKKHRKQAWLRE